MSDEAISKVQAQIQGIDEMLSQIVQGNYLPDKIYTKLTAAIGHLDEIYLATNKLSKVDQRYSDWVKERLAKVCDVLVSLKKQHSVALTDTDEDLMHPTGDYYNEDNSAHLSPEISGQLKTIIADKYSA